MPSTPHGDGCPDCGADVPPDANYCPGCGTATAADPDQCGVCGHTFDAADEFCSTCGSPRQDEAGVEHASTEFRLFRDAARRHTEAGWEVEADHGDRVELVDRSYGSVLLHLLLVFTTGGLGNLLYGWFHYTERARRRTITMDSHDFERPVHASAPEDSSLNVAVAYALSGVLLLLSTFFLAGALDGNGAAPAIIGGLLLAGGLLSAPAVERRLRERLTRRHSLAEFGRLRTVDHRIVRPFENCEADCVVCGEPVDAGVVRRRRDETVLAGFPVLTRSLEENHYCTACAAAELDVGPGAGRRSAHDRAVEGRDTDSSTRQREHAESER
ncbi:hypothetical protein JCM17823_28760 [Halorubrum gandharaense]